MTQYANNFEGGTAGASIPSPTVVGGDAFTIARGASGTDVYTATAGEVINGSTSAKVTAGSAENNVLQRALTGTAVGMSFTYRPLLPATRTVNHIIGRPYASGSLRAAAVTVLAGSSNTSGSLKLSSNNADMQTITNVSFPCMIKLAADPGTTAADGKLKWLVTTLDGVTPNGTGMVSGGVEYTGKQTTSGAAIILAAFAFSGTDAEIRTAIFDDLIAVDSYTFPTPAANNPPVVSAGSTQTVAANTLVTLAATATDSDGSVASVAWTQNSGPTVTLSSTTINGPTFTPTVPGVVSLRFTATDNLGATAFSDVIINVTAPSSRPSSTVSNAGVFTNQGGAASLEAALADESDTTYIQSPSGPAGAVIIFSITPLSTGSITVKHRSKQDISSPVITRLSELLQAPSNTVIASHSDNLTTTWTDYTWTVTDTQAATITDRNSLRVRITDTQN